MPKAGSSRTFENPDLGLVVKSVLVDEVPVKQSYESEEEAELKSLHFLFASILGNDSWFGFAVTDDMHGEPEHSMSRADPCELKKMSVFIGDPWREIESDCVHCASLRHRKMVREMSDQIRADVMDTPIAQLRFKRQSIEFETWQRWAKELPLSLSMN